MSHFTEDNIIGAITLDESDGLQIEQYASTSTEDNNDDDINVLDAETALPETFVGVLEDVLGIGDDAWEAYAATDGLIGAALSNYGISAVTGTTDLSGDFTAFEAGTSLTLNGELIDLSGISNGGDLLTAINAWSGTTFVTASLDATGALVLTADTTNPSDPVVIAASTALDELGLVAGSYTTDTSFATTKMIEFTGDNLDFLRFSSDGTGEEFPLDGFGLAGVDSGLYTTDGNKIFLYIDPNTDTLIGREGLGDVSNPDGDAVLAIYLEQQLLDNNTLIQARIWTVQFEPIYHDDTLSVDEEVDLTDVVFLTSTDNLEFDASNAPSGQNLFIMFGNGELDGDSNIEVGIVATGLYPVDQGDPGSPGITAGDTVNTSQAGGDTTFGVNNQMVTSASGGNGETLVFSFVTGLEPTYTTPDLDQNEADVEANIDFTGVLAANKAIFDIVQTQGGKTGVITITAVDGDFDATDSGDAFVGALEDDVANLATRTVDITRIEINGELAGKGNTTTPFTSIAISTATSGTTVGGVDYTTVDGNLVGTDTANNLVYTFYPDGSVQIYGIDAGYSIEYVTDADHNRVFLQNTGDDKGQDSAEFDIGGFELIDISTETLEIGSHINWEDDGLEVGSPATLYVEEEQIDNALSEGNEDHSDPGSGFIPDTEGVYDNINDYVTVDLSTLLTADGIDQPVTFTFDSDISSLPTTYTSKGAAIVYDSSTSVEDLTSDTGGTLTLATTLTEPLYVLQIDDDDSGVYDPGETILVYTSDSVTGMVEGLAGTDVVGTGSISVDGATVDANGWTVDQIVTWIDGLGGVDAVLDGDGAIVITTADTTSFATEGLGGLGIADATYAANNVEDLRAAINASSIATAALVSGELEISSTSGNTIRLSGYETEFANSDSGLTDGLHAVRTHTLTGQVVFSAAIGSELEGIDVLTVGVYEISGETYAITGAPDHTTLADLIVLINAGTKATAALVDGELVLESKDGNALELSGFDTTEFGVADGTVLDAESVALGTGLAGGTVLDQAVYGINGETYTIDGTADHSTLDDLIALINAGTEATAALIGDQLVLGSPDGEALTLIDFDTGQFGVADGTEWSPTRAVFTWDVREDGESTFQVHDQLDHDGVGEDILSLELGSILNAHDADGDAVDVSGLGTYGVLDDIPIATGSVESIDVDEDSLGRDTDGAGTDDILDGDDGSTGNIDGNPLRTGEVDGGGLDIVSGSLSSLVSVGTDEDAIFELKAANTTLLPSDWTSKGALIVYDVTDNVLSAKVYSAAIGSGLSLDDPLIGVAYSINGDSIDFSGGTLAELIDAINDDDGQEAAASLVGGELVLESKDGESLTLSGFDTDFGGGTDAEYTTTRTVYTLTLESNGDYVFDLEDQVDHPTNDTEDTLVLNLSEMIEVADADGDSLVLPSMTDPDGEGELEAVPTFGVTIYDDIPVVYNISNTIFSNEGATPTGIGIFDYGIGSDERSYFSADNSDFENLVLSGALGGAEGTDIENATVTWVSEDDSEAVFSFEFDYQPNPSSEDTETATGTITFNKDDGTYSVTLDEAISGFSILNTADTVSSTGYNLIGNSPSQYEIVVSQLTDPSSADQFYVQFMGDQEKPSGTPRTAGGDDTFAAGEIFSAGITYATISNAENGVAGDTIQNNEILDLDFFTFNPDGDGDPGYPTLPVEDDPTALYGPDGRADGIYLKFDNIGDNEDIVVVLKLIDADGVTTTTKLIRVDAEDIVKNDTQTETLLPSVYEIVLDNNDGAVIIESNDYNIEPGEEWQIYGMQILTSTGDITGTAIDLNAETGEVLGSSGAHVIGTDNGYSTGSVINLNDVTVDGSPDFDVTTMGELIDAINALGTVGAELNSDGALVIASLDGTDFYVEGLAGIGIATDTYDVEYQALEGTGDQDVVKIVDIGFIILDSGQLDANLSLDFNLVDADMDKTATQSLDIDIVGGSTFTGGNDNDAIAGTTGMDTFEGGDGADVFIFVDPTYGFDTLNDFDSSEGDQIWISASGFGLTIDGLLSDAEAGDPAINADYFVSGSVWTTLADDSDDYFLFDTDDNKLYFDADGNAGVESPVHIATFNFNSGTLTSDDIFLIA